MLIVIIITSVVVFIATILFFNIFLSKKIEKMNEKIKLPIAENNEIYDNESILDGGEIKEIFGQYLEDSMEEERSRTPVLE